MRMATNILFRRRVVRFLGASESDTLAGMSEAEWRRNLGWLDRSGLALPLAARLELSGPSAGVPVQIRDTLRARLLDNQSRMQTMLGFFAEVNKALSESGVHYCCVKGFSLIPECFSGIDERHQVDLDFLVAPRDRTRARSAVEALGYRAEHGNDSGEVRLTKPWKKHLGVDAYLYQQPEPPPVELHSKVWEPEAEAIDFLSLQGFFDAVEMHETEGVQFPRLLPAHQFVYLLLHVFRHLLGSWTRLLSFYEIATFIRVHSASSELWSDVSEIIGKEAILASACALVLSLTEATFPQDAGFPEPLREVYGRNLSPESAQWIESYSGQWLYTDPPGNKIALLVQEQFYSDRTVWRQYLRRRLLPFRGAHALSDEAGEATKATLAYRVEELSYQLSRVWYHVRSDFEYLVARFRWEKLMQRDTRSASRIVGRA
jgi:hypothetical protein